MGMPCYVLLVHVRSCTYSYFSSSVSTIKAYENGDGIHDISPPNWFTYWPACCTSYIYGHVWPSLNLHAPLRTLTEPLLQQPTMLSLSTLIFWAGLLLAASIFSQVQYLFTLSCRTFPLIETEGPLQYFLLATTSCPGTAARKMHLLVAPGG